MDPVNTRSEIERLEAHIALLTESLDKCRKIALAAQLAVGAGLVLIVLMLIGVLAFAPVNMVGALAAVIGGIVLYGSNASTWKQMETARAQAQALRTELIETMELRVVEDSPPIC